MPLSLTFENAAHKNQLVAGLACLLAVDCGDASAANINAAVETSGNAALPKGYAAAFAAYATKAPVDKMCPPLGGGGGGGAAAPAAAAAAPAPAAAKPAEVEVDPMEGGMDMFGGGGGGGDY